MVERGPAPLGKLRERAAAVKLSLSEISTVGASFAEDVAAYAAAGLRRHRHLGVQARRTTTTASIAAPARERPRRRQLRARDPVDPAARAARHGGAGRSGRAHRGAVREHGAAWRASSRRRSLCLTGPVGDRSEAEARAIVRRRACAQVAAAARAAGVRLGLEPTHASESARDVVPLVDRRGDRAARRGRASTTSA